MKIPFDVNRWKSMAYLSRNIFCDGSIMRFLSLDSKKVHLLKTSNFLCILHRLFELGTFFCLLFELRTVFLIRTKKLFLDI